MLKALLYVCVSLLPFLTLAQPEATGWASTLDTVSEDSNQVISEINCTAAGSSAVSLNWKTASRVPEFFVVERSEDERSFETVAILNNPNAKPEYQWTDEAPKKGKSFYRIRYSFKQNEPLYSKTVPCYVEGTLSFKFYPNPVDHILIVRSDNPIDVLITDNNGRTRISEPRVQGLHTINVSSLEKGIYLIRFSSKLTNVMSQEKLVKN